MKQKYTLSFIHSVIRRQELLCLPSAKYYRNMLTEIIIFSLYAISTIFFWVTQGFLSSGHAMFSVLALL